MTHDEGNLDVLGNVLRESRESKSDRRDGSGSSLRAAAYPAAFVSHVKLHDEFFIALVLAGIIRRG